MKQRVLVGGKPRDWRYMHNIEVRAKALEKASTPPKPKKMRPGEERQLVLPGLG